jgi:hypothetical protein
MEGAFYFIEILQFYFKTFNKAYIKTLGSEYS